MPTLHRITTSNLSKEQIKRLITARERFWDLMIEETRAAIKPERLKHAIRALQREKRRELAHARQLFADQTAAKRHTKKRAP